MKIREKEIVAVAAALAAGCVDCLYFHKNEAIKSGLTENELKEIANLAFAIRRKAYKLSKDQLNNILNNSNTDTKIINEDQNPNQEDCTSVDSPSSNSPCC